MTTPTITQTIINHETVEFVLDGLSIPIVVGSHHGINITARDMTQRRRIDPADCAHAGARWSSNLALRCPSCGAEMFLPPRLLAYQSAATIAAMEELWSAAAWPEWSDSGWHIQPERWRIVSHPLFDYLGGLPVRLDREQHFQDALESMALES